MISFAFHLWEIYTIYISVILNMIYIIPDLLFGWFEEKEFLLYFLFYFNFLKETITLVYQISQEKKNNRMEAWIDRFCKTDYENWLMQFWRLRSSTIYHAGNGSKSPLPLPYRLSLSEDWVRPPTLGRAIYFTESTDSNVYLIQKHAFRHL